MGSFSPLSYSSTSGGSVTNYVSEPVITNSWGGTDLTPVTTSDFDLEGGAFVSATDRRHKLGVINKLNQYLGVYISDVEAAEPGINQFTHFIPPDTYTEIDAGGRYATFRPLDKDANGATSYSGFLRLVATSLRYSVIS